MNDNNDHTDESKNFSRNKWIRGVLGAAGSIIPFAGGFISAASNVWGEKEQEQAIEALRAWIKMLEDELKEKQRTILEIMARLDMQNEQIAERVKSSEYQSLLKQVFRNWAGTESRKKQVYIRNVLTNAASASFVDDDVIRLFIKWLHDYSELHFAVMGEIYKQPGATRGDIWDRLGKGQVREDSAEADLFRLLVRDLSTGGIIRQHRETDYEGNFLARSSASKRNAERGTQRVMTSAFDDNARYELTSLGGQFVHHAMTEVTVKIEFRGDDDNGEYVP